MKLLQPRALLLCAGAASAYVHSVPTRHVQVPGQSNDAYPLRPDLFGYSIEPSSVASYVSSNISSNLLLLVSSIIGKAAPIRIGGTTSDEITVVPHVNTSSGYSSSDQGSSGGNNGPATIELETRWYNIWANYFPNGTDFIYTLNFQNETLGWTNAIQEANAVIKTLGHKLIRFEFGNEVDHYISKDWRNSSWGVVPYTAQYRALKSKVQALPEFQALQPRVKIQAGVIADPPKVPDQQDEIDDFDIVNLTTKAGLTNNDGTISSYAVHLYPQSNCDAARQARLSLDLLSNHTVLWTNVSQYIPQQRAAVAAGAPLVFGETNSVSCGGKSGISDTFGAALWTVDYALMAASLGINQISFHLGEQSEYSAFTPLPYTLQNENLTAGVRANFYAHLFVAHLLKGCASSQPSIEALSGANASDFSGYAVREGGQLKKLVFLDMGVWNSTKGLSNPSTLHHTDSTYHSSGQRPESVLTLDTTWPSGTYIAALRLQAPGTNAKSGVSISGQTVDQASGKLATKAQAEKYTVGPNGRLVVKLNRAEGLLLQA